MGEIEKMQMVCSSVVDLWLFQAVRYHGFAVTHEMIEKKQLKVGKTNASSNSTQKMIQVN